MHQPTVLVTEQDTGAYTPRGPDHHFITKNASRGVIVMRNSHKKGRGIKRKEKKLSEKLKFK